MEWKYVKPIESSKLIVEFEKQFNFKFPEAYKACVLEYNGGRPAKKVFDTAEVKEREMKSLLSFNYSDRETMWKVNQSEDNNAINDYVAFATDCSGNRICFNKADCSIVFVDHETDTVENITDSFDGFISSLYDI